MNPSVDVTVQRPCLHVTLLNNDQLLFNIVLNNRQNRSDPFCPLFIGTMLNNNALKNVTCKQGLTVKVEYFGLIYTEHSRLHVSLPGVNKHKNFYLAVSQNFSFHDKHFFQWPNLVLKESYST